MSKPVVDEFNPWLAGMNQGKDVGVGTGENTLKNGQVTDYAACPLLASYTYSPSLYVCGGQGRIMKM